MDSRTLLPLSQPALERGEKVEASVRIRNVDRVVGTIVGSEISKRFGEQGLPEDTITFNCNGSAGQSFGAFIPRGLTLRLEGDANDYTGKGLSGGKLIAFPPAASSFVAKDNIIIGNTAFYGATGGEAYICGMAGERFAVRNSGAQIVVEGVGNHGLEYMTGGIVVNLGAAGKNFAAGMSGGVAYVYNPDGLFERQCNQEMVLLESVTDREDIRLLKTLLKKHAAYTKSELANQVLEQWKEALSFFVKVIPSDYKRMLAVIEQGKQNGMAETEAIMAAFGENKMSRQG